MVGVTFYSSACQRLKDRWGKMTGERLDVGSWSPVLKYKMFVSYYSTYVSEGHYPGIIHI